ncbi:multidrug effflux MFS transporter [Nakamurella endophytica]|uniref:multidrug effflux MFS transporter n=1 Tax=Nakamurella endophytica TaxID=1748367 RepID=UPI001E568786|nr:multidrug effflux MFS transporter [Nakamurella endophytica]
MSTPETRGPAALPRSRTPSTWFIVLLASLMAVGPFTIDLYLAAFPQITADFGTRGAAVQATLTTTMAGLALGQLVIGSLSDALGRRRPLVGGLVLYVAASLAITVAPNVGVLAGLRFVQGFAAAAGTVLAMAMIRDRYQGVAMGKALARMMLVTGVAPCLAPVIGAQVLQIGSWRHLFAGLAVVGVVLLLLTIFVLPETLPAERRRSNGVGAAVRSYGSLLTDRGFVGLALLNGFAFGALFSFVSSSSFVFQEGFGFSSQQFSAVFAAGAVGVTLGTQLSGFLIGRVSPGRIVLGGSLTGLTVAVLLLLAAETGAGAWIVAALCVLIMVVVGIILPAVPVLALDANAHRAGSAAALLGAVQFGVGAAVAPLSGLIGEGDPAAMAVVLVGSMLVSTAITVTLRRRLRPVPATSLVAAPQPG